MHVFSRLINKKLILDSAALAVLPPPSGAITPRVINERHKCSSFASKDGGQISAAFRTVASVMRGGYRWGPVDPPTQERRGRQEY